MPRRPTRSVRRCRRRRGPSRGPSPGQGLTGRVERALDGLFGRGDHPLREVAHVDELHGPLRRRGREHVSALRDPYGPVSEAAAGIVRAHDQTGADVRVAVRKELADDILGERLQAAVGVLLAHRHPVLRGRVAEDDRRRALVEPRRQRFGIDGQARDEDVVVHGAGEQLGRRSNHAGHEAARVDHRVPASPFERREVAVAVAAELLRLGEELGVRLAAVEERHLVPALERGFRCGAAEELRPAEDQQLHSVSSSARSRSTSSAVL